ncbi:MAG: hypothetical protein A2Y56_08225 [Candidatus Aminicenantes bacterium RBG_13_63_10]|nr:MAG: hypothetical protein A2Y56_08225 [Candidatus Aminicenantes bacterium RBG_13_63_10]
MDQKLLVLLGPLLLFLAGTAAAQVPAGDEICLSCHVGENIRLIQDSIHGRAALTCRDCHADLKGVEAFPHRAGLVPAVCTPCHGRLAGAASAVPVHALQSRADLVSGPAVRLVRKIYLILIGFMLLSLVFLIAARLLGSKRHMLLPDKSPDISDDERFIRMNLSLRLRHLSLAVSVVLLLATGLPALLSGDKSLAWLVSPEGAPPARVGVHLFAAGMLVLTVLWHLASAAFSPAGRAHFREMIPRGKDFRDVLKLAGSRLSPARFRPPSAGRYGFIEKFEHWAAAWGSAVMIVSGFFMWRPDLSLRLFPAWVHGVFIAVHRWESVMIFIWVLLGHIYIVHFRPEVFPMSRAWLDGQISGRQLRLLHPLEYRELAETRRRRERREPNPYENVKS